MNIVLSSQTLPTETLLAGRDLLKAYFSEAVVKVKTGNEESILRDLRQTQVEPVKAITAVILVEVPHGVTGQLELRWLILGEHTSVQDDEQDIPLLRDYRTCLSEKEIALILAQPEIGTEIPSKFLLKHGLFKLLSQVCQKVLPWGILTGIRPGKLLQRLYDLGLDWSERTEVLEKRYAIRMDKIKVLQDIALVQRPCNLEIQQNPQKVAVYVGIPFCPTRCTYCSFPGYPLGKERLELKPYLDALYGEIQQCGELMQELGLEADSVYIGGGTPTVLTANQLQNLVTELKRCLPWQHCRELTVEAGRPDTLSREILETLKDCKVTRLSINPQTMQDITLTRIGRQHDVAQVIQVFNLARSLSDWVINMDLILGLPGEGLAEVSSTLKQLAQLQPENLTVHMLALKKGSRETEKGYKHLPDSVLEQMQELSAKVAESWVLRPYYLYRQKQIAGNLENIGYAQPGTECRYNISIIEERQSILGLGAGASSKVVNLSKRFLTNWHHPSNWQAYIEHWQLLDVKRAQSLRVLYK